MKKVIVALTFVLFSTKIFAQDPNVVFILVDDLGWNGTSVQMDLSQPNSKSDYHLTPNIKSIADNGAILSKAYGAAPVCSPARNSILTGKSTARSGYTDNEDNSTNASQQLFEAVTREEIDDSDITIAEQIKLYNSNYLTANFGKWDLGGNDPGDHGFDEHDGDTASPQGNNGDQVNDPKRIFSIRDDAIAFIQRAKTEGKPFYMQLSEHAPHNDFFALASTLNHWQNNVPAGTLHNDPLYAAMIADLDSSIGDILTELQNNGYDSTNTYIVFMSDHGANDTYADLDPLRDGKPSLYEGGIRVPMFVSGPGIAAGTRIGVNVSALDVFPTIMHWITGNSSNVPSDIDGGTMKRLLEGNSTRVNNRTDDIVLHFPHYLNMQTTLISGDYKLIVNYRQGNLGSIGMYDLANDISESTDIQGTHPTEFLEMKCRLRDYLNNVGARFPSLNTTHPDIAAYGGTPTDGDNDGLDDAWEYQNLLFLREDGTDSSDGDSFSNSEEFAAGSDPLCVADSTLSIDNIDSNDGIIIYPNPTKGIINIKLNRNSPNFKLVVRSILGNKIVETNYVDQLDISNFNSGIYFLSILKNGNKIYNKKVILY